MMRVTTAAFELLHFATGPDRLFLAAHADTDIRERRLCT